MSFEVKNKKIEGILKKIGRAIKKALPKGWGFTLLVFDYSKPGEDAGSMFYISSANRADMVKAMREFIHKQEVPREL